MHQFSFMEKFNADVDGILAGNSQASRQEVQTEYDDLLNLAVVLAEADIAPENRKKQILRRQMINRYTQNTNNKEAIMKKFLGKHRPALLASSFALVALLGFYLILPGTFTAMANSILKLGPYVTLVNDNTDPDPSAATPLTAEQRAQLEKNGYLEFTDENGNLILIGNPAKAKVETVSYSNLADAQEGVSYNLLAPSYLPQGYSFKNAECYQGSKEYITLKYQGPGKDILLMQRLMNEQTQYETGGEVEPVKINGNNGAWIDSSLTWQIEDVNYTLIAKGCSKDETMKIAESVK